jgi:chaperonin GroES
MTNKVSFTQQLLDDLIAVALLDKAEGVIKLPDWQRILRGEVIAVGPGRMLPLGERAPMECSVGDIVSFAATAGMDSQYGVGRSIRLMRDTDVDAIVESEKSLTEQLHDNYTRVIERQTELSTL